jgi:hypothetical protein
MLPVRPLFLESSPGQPMRHLVLSGKYSKYLFNDLAGCVKSKLLDEVNSASMASSAPDLAV